MDCRWNWIFGDLETFLTFFFILGSKLNFPMDENRFSHNNLTRRTDPRAPEGPLIFFKGGSYFCDFQFSRSWAQGPWAQGPMGPWAQGHMGPRAHGSMGPGRVTSCHGSVTSHQG